MRVTYLFLEFGVFVLSMDKIEDDVECASEDEGKEKAEPSKICISLGAIEGSVHSRCGKIVEAH